GRRRKRSRGSRELAAVRSSPAAAEPAAVVARSSSRRSTAASSPALGARPIDHAVPIPEDPARQLGDGAARLLGRPPVHEAEAPGAARELVGNDPDRLDGPDLLEELPEVLLRGLVGQVAYEELRGHRSPPASETDKKAPAEARLFEGG